MPTYAWESAPRAVREQIEQFIGRVQTILGDGFVGAYLHGSLAMGCFNPASSDVDILVVTHDPMPLKAKREIIAFLLDLSGRPAPIEVSFLARPHLDPWQYPTPFDLHYSEMWRPQYEQDLASEGWRLWEGQTHRDPDLAAHITVLRARGVCLAGAPIAEIFPAVPREDYLASVTEDIAWGLERLAENPAYAILNMCRTLAYLCEGKVLSKAEGGEWALAHLEEALHAPVRAAWEAYTGAGSLEGFDATALEPWLKAMGAALRQAGLPLAPDGAR